MSTPVLSLVSCSNSPRSAAFPRSGFIGAYVACPHCEASQPDDDWGVFQSDTLHTTHCVSCNLSFSFETRHCGDCDATIALSWRLLKPSSRYRPVGCHQCGSAVPRALATLAAVCGVVRQA